MDIKKIDRKKSSILRICRILKKQFPERKEEFYKLGVSTELLRHLIDNEWVNQSIFKQHALIEKKNRKGFDFLNAEESDFIWQHRIQYLAERVYNLKKVENFNYLRSEILNGELVSRFAELEVAAHLMRRNVKIKFVKPIGKKKSDYDLKIIDEVTINCEIKHKLNTTNLSFNTLKNSISRANKQLPKNEWGIIFFKISQEWIRDVNFKKHFLRVISAFFKRNQNILGVVLRWEEQDVNFKNIFYLKYKLEQNPEIVFEKKTKQILEKMLGRKK